MGYGKFQDIIDHIQACLNADDFAHTCRVRLVEEIERSSKKGSKLIQKYCN